VFQFPVVYDHDVPCAKTWPSAGRNRKKWSTAEVKRRVKRLPAMIDMEAAGSKGRGLTADAKQKISLGARQWWREGPERAAV